MQRFRRYITSMQDRDELLLSAVDSICREKRRLHHLRHKVLPEQVEVTLEEFENRVSNAYSHRCYAWLTNLISNVQAKLMHVQDVEPFLNSLLFQKHNYTYNEAEKVITKKY